MEQVKTKEYEGLPEIKRNEPKHFKPSGDKLWSDAKEGLLSGEALNNEKN